ncbi:unnamed protein product (macronuclear) [Paramecium tetraurelia]|uniref:Major facilitator superfamily (MFS) profile domain-containing protein n=1 Tax=Paramecium tetraurelia TaxID=5888 RepID=A0DTB7_PARTE|nr:uncharacterized protein GSPATT00019977001 [Paramecium tetraurelia]CAK86284.1 unnamed protein product [Paramecium tetraurelia]|eukprot:XP_001453681.1 hypothetical protein (macronuclear) [Paramecium tetraurelia strain d4-2]
MKLQPKYPNFYKLLYCTTIIMLCYTFQNAGKSISYNIYNSQGLTFLYSMQFTINYFISPIALLFMDAIISRLSMSTILYLGSFNAFAFLLGAFVVSSCQQADLFYCNVSTLTLAIAIETLLGGVASCLLFVGYPVYINSISNPQNKSYYFGIGYSIYSISSFTGNTIGYFTSTKIEPFYYYSILIVGLAITQLFLFRVEDLRDRTQIVKQSFSNMFKQQIKQLKNAFNNKDYQAFIPFLIFCSMLQGCYFTFLPALLKHVQGGITINEHTFLLYLIGGLGMMLGGIFAGKLSQKANLFIVGWCQVFFAILFVILAMTSYYWKILNTTYTTGFFCGIVFTGTESLAAMITGVLVSDKSYYFVANDILICLGIALTSSISLLLSKSNLQAMVYVVMMILMLNIVSLIYAQRIFKTPNKNSKVQLLN